MNKTVLHASLATLLALGSFSANAFEKGDFLIRAGAIVVAPDDSSSNIKTGGTSLGGDVDVDSDTQLGLNFAYMLSNHIAIELLAATPFSHDVGVGGSPAGLGSLNGDLGDVKQLPPTLSLLYYPFDSANKFQPYLGLGINYTVFFDESVDRSAKAKGFSDLNLEESWGWSGQMGMDYMLTDNILLNAQIRYIDIDTDADVDLDGVGRLKVDVDVDPWVYMVGIGYKF